MKTLVALLALALPAFGAVVTGPLQDISAAAYNTTGVEFWPLSTPLVNGSGVVVGPRKIVQPTNGNFAITLVAGCYLTKFLPTTNTITICVPNSTNTYTLAELSTNTSAVTGIASPLYKVRISSADTNENYLAGKILKGSNITITTNATTGTLTIASTGGGGSFDTSASNSYNGTFTGNGAGLTNYSIQDALTLGAVSSAVNQKPSFASIANITINGALTNAEKSKFTFTGGFVPGGTGWNDGAGYPNCYIYDMATLGQVDAAGCFGSNYISDVQWTNIAYMFARVAQTNGYSMPAGIHQDTGAPTQTTKDGTYEFIHFVWLHYLRSGSASLYTANKTTIERTLTNAAYHISNGCVYAENQTTAAQGWGYNESLGGKGHDLITSCFRFRALKCLSALETATSGSGAATYESLAADTASGLTNFLYDSANGLFYATSLVNTQHHMLGSALAVYVGAVTPTVSNAVVTALARRMPGGDLDLRGYGFINQNGAARFHDESGWFQGSQQTESYQQGGYWHVGIDWLHYAIKGKYPATAATLAGACLNTMASATTNGVREYYYKTGSDAGAWHVMACANSILMMSTNYSSLLLPVKKYQPQLYGTSAIITDRDYRDPMLPGNLQLESFGNTGDAAIWLYGTNTSSVTFGIGSNPQWTWIAWADGTFQLLHYALGTVPYVFDDADDLLHGSGAGLTNLNASSLASGTVGMARLSANVTTNNGTLAATVLIGSGGRGAINGAATSAQLVHGDGSGITAGSGVETFLQTPSSANLASAVTDETGSGVAMFSNNPGMTNSPGISGGLFVGVNTNSGNRWQGPMRISGDWANTNGVAVTPSGFVSSNAIGMATIQAGVFNSTNNGVANANSNTWIHIGRAAFSNASSYATIEGSGNANTIFPADNSGLRFWMIGNQTPLSLRSLGYVNSGALNAYFGNHTLELGTSGGTARAAGLNAFAVNDMRVVGTSGAGLASLTASNMYASSTMTATNGFASFATDTAAISSTSNWTNTTGKNVFAYVTGAAIALKNASATTLVDFGAAFATATGTIHLHPSWYLTGTTISGTYVAE